MTLKEVRVASLFLWLLSAPLLFVDEARASDRLRVTVTIPPQAWLVRQVGGDRVDVRSLVGPGDSPATFSPSDAQITGLTRSAVFFRIGVPAENAPWFRAVERLGRPGIVDLRKGVALRRMEDHHHGGHHHGGHRHEGGFDPHIWLSPERLRIMAGTVARTLTEIDPGGREVYAQNLEVLVALLWELEDDVRGLLAPCEAKSFFVFHPTWGYFADDFGLTQVSIEREGKEPSESELAELTRLARAQGVRTIFVQPQFQGRSTRMLAQALGAEIKSMDPLSVDLASCLKQVAEEIRNAQCGEIE